LHAHRRSSSSVRRLAKGFLDDVVIAKVAEAALELLFQTRARWGGDVPLGDAARETLRRVEGICDRMWKASRRERS
jgi:hypothetical protein